MKAFLELVYNLAFGIMAIGGIFIIGTLLLQGLYFFITTKIEERKERKIKQKEAYRQETLKKIGIK